MAVELVLLEDVEQLGRIGDQVRVAEGYARNYLLPRNLAAVITQTSLRQLEAKKLRLQREHEERLSVAKTVAERIAQESVTIPVQAGEDDQLYGSVTAAGICEALAANGLDIERKAVLLPEPIRELGVYSVEIALHADVQTSLKVWVVRA